MPTADSLETLNVTTELRQRSARTAAFRSYLQQFRALEILLLITIFFATYTKLFWHPLGNITLSNILAIVFTSWFVWERTRNSDWIVPKEVATALIFSVGFGLIYLTGFFNTTTASEQTQFLKAFVTWLIQALYMLSAAATIARSGRKLAFACLYAFLAGTGINALYGFAQLIAISALHLNLDNVVLTPLHFPVKGSRGIQFFGGNLYRMNGMMKDTNHFGVMLAAPIPIALMVLRGRIRTFVTAGFALALLMSLSRSGVVGLFGGMLVVAWSMRRRLANRQLGIAIVASIIAVVAFSQIFPMTWGNIVVSRFNVHGTSAQTHLQLYALLPELLREHPFFGLGLNGFALQFADASGRVEFGPHSYYIQLLTESGAVGFGWFLLFAGYLMTILTRVDRRIAIGLAGAIVATWSGNLFYLTMQIFYVPALYAIVLAAPAALTREPPDINTA